LPAQRLRDIDFIKGIAIVLIVLGHDTQINLAGGWLQPAIYRFHVHIFLLLPFVFPMKDKRVGYLLDRAVRYFAPHLALMLFASVLYSFMTGRSLSTFLIDLILALVIGSEDFIKLATGFSLYWFMPCLVSMTLLRLLNQFQSRVVILVCAVALLFAGLIPREYLVYSPQGIIRAMYLYLMGVAIGWLTTHRPSPACFAGALGGFACTGYVLYSHDTLVNISEVYVPTVLDGPDFLLSISHPIFAFMTLFWGAPYLNKTLPFMHAGASWIGRQSLIIYLFHSLVLQAIFLVLAKFLGIISPEDTNALVKGVVLVGAVLLPVPIGWAIKRLPRLDSLVFPRTRAGWSLAWSGKKRGI